MFEVKLGEEEKLDLKTLGELVELIKEPIRLAPARGPRIEIVPDNSESTSES